MQQQHPSSSSFPPPVSRAIDKWDSAEGVDTWQISRVPRQSSLQCVDTIIIHRSRSDRLFCDFTGSVPVWWDLLPNSCFTASHEWNPSTTNRSVVAVAVREIYFHFPWSLSSANSFLGCCCRWFLVSVVVVVVLAVDDFLTSRRTNCLQVVHVVCWPIFYIISWSTRHVTSNY